MSVPIEDLVWGDPDSDRIRNIKITYAVVYLGRYDLTSEEEVGSHLAVDIKIPLGTPLRSIANGRVSKISLGSAGFGHHVVIEHPNVPDPKNPGRTTTLYSSYSHMDLVNVVEGQTVIKGERIGTSGSTGTATTPHVHFQLDIADAPWHPYWPFTSAEASASGLFFLRR
ncbi:M23 family metallopeptidase [Candidatus Peregrinibacteria bacterium]|nr:MAG: M23 family metallopeptidase [Candidatus Peregrinibacteria bacterium]